MKLEDIRKLCDAAISRPSEFDDSLFAWQSFLLEHGEKLLKVVEAAQDLVLGAGPRARRRTSCSAKDLVLGAGPRARRRTSCSAEDLVLGGGSRDAVLKALAALEASP